MTRHGMLDGSKMDPSLIGTHLILRNKVEWYDNVINKMKEVKARIVKDREAPKKLVCNPNLAAICSLVAMIAYYYPEKE